MAFWLALLDRVRWEGKRIKRQDEKREKFIMRPLDLNRNGLSMSNRQPSIMGQASDER